MAEETPTRLRRGFVWLYPPLSRSFEKIFPLEVFPYV